MGRRYAGVHASCELTPLLKWDGDLVVNLADHSRYVGTTLTYSLRTNLDLRLGVGAVTAADIDGGLDIDVSTATVRTRNTSGRLRIDTGSGSVAA